MIFMTMSHHVMSIQWNRVEWKTNIWTQCFVIMGSDLVENVPMVWRILLKRFLGLVMFEFEFLEGSDFLIVLVSENCPNMVIGGKERCFSLKIMVWHFTSFELKKNDKNFLQVTGGTLAKHRQNPVMGSVRSVGPFLGCPEISLAEPIWGCRQIRQVWKTRQSTNLTCETIFKFFENS